MTVVRAFRLDEDLDEALRRASEEEGESVNVIANRILRRFVEWDRPAGKMGLMEISREELVKLIDAQSTDQARSLGAWVGIDILEPFVRYLHPTVNLGTFIDSLELLARYSNRFEFDHTVEEKKHMLVIRHSMGAKWSAFYEGAASSMLRDLLHINFESSTTDELCSFKFELEAEGHGR